MHCCSLGKHYYQVYPDRTMGRRAREEAERREREEKQRRLDELRLKRKVPLPIT